VSGDPEVKMSSNFNYSYMASYMFGFLAKKGNNSKMGNGIYFKIAG
jgi:hypothetical protein